MMKVDAVPVPEGSLLAEFGSPAAYRDCFRRQAGEAVSLEQLIERFYSSPAFRPERILLGLIGKGADDTDAKAVARGETGQFAAWNVVDRRQDEILLQDFRGSTASWLCVRKQADKTDLLFGSWVGEPDRTVVKALLPFHRWYSRMLLRGFV
ncbi:MAG: hypothetical protein QNJ15_02115 [Erythrobacter sp.]|nr:hypothetical protein [Erythrobacter sp.]